ncbi:MAG: hypothetical protein WDA75_13055 [Candidatus Latescibacterota bacterium]|jgi:hypothetical protein
MELFTSDSGSVACREGFPLSAAVAMVLMVGVVLGIAVPAMALTASPSAQWSAAPVA